MNKSDSKQNIKPTVRILSYLTAKIPADRHVLILHGNLLITAGSLIAIIETFIAVSLGLHHVPYTHTIFISIIILSMTTVFTSIPYFKKNLRIWHELALFLIYLLFFLFAFCLWEYRLGELRFLAIINAITSIIILLSYTNIFQSLLISISTLICYYSISWYAIKISGQPGSLQKEAFLSFCLFPAFMLISFAAYYVNKSRIEIQRIKNELEKTNNELTNTHAQLKKENLLTGIEMDLASEIQGALFPGKVPDTSDWDIAFYTKPYGAVTGDFYDFYCEYNLLKGISLFDVSGHGVAPALITILAKPVLYKHFKHCEFLRLGEVIESANADLFDQLEEVNLFITGIMLRMDGPTVEYINAGHPDLLHLHSTEKKIFAIKGSSDLFKGNPIGISNDDNEYFSFKFNVPSGDFVLLYSDGVTESRNFSGELFGISRLSNGVESFHGGDAEDLLNHIIDILNSFTGEVKAGDDITIIVAGKK